jgi:hypothetical protein
MTDLPSSLGIEAVELLVDGESRPPRSVTVRVIGRWRRRRPELRGQAILVVETEAGRQRFLAMPEPPSLTGAAPGTWRMSFAVPAALAPSLPGRTFLQLGGVMVPLPIGEVAPARESPRPADPDLLEARRARSSELAAESARRRAAELAAEVQRLEQDLAQAHEESERLRGAIAERDRRLRSVEQDAHAEQALRSDLEEELTRRTRGARHDLAVLHERARDLEQELVRMRRAVDEAGHLASAAEAGRRAAERRLAERAPAVPPPPPPPPATAPPSPPTRLLESARRAAPIRRELELSRVAPGAQAPGAAPAPADRAGDRIALRQEAAMADLRAAAGAADPERVTVLEGELAGAREEVRGLRAKVEAQRAEIEVQRGEIEAQRGEIEAQRAENEAQRRRTARAYEAIELVRGELRQLGTTRSAAPASRPPVPPPEPPSTAAPAAAQVQPERLSEALARLRAHTPVMSSEAEGEAAPASEPARPHRSAVDRPVKPWLGTAFRALAKQDASTAGHLLLTLLPAQRAADPHPVAYDLVLSDVLCAHVTVDSTAAHVDLDPTTRPLAEVDFELVGDLASIARLLAAGRVRRRLGRLAPGRRLARVRGDRGRVAALDRLVEAALTLEQLGAAGVAFDPLLAMTVVSVMIDPGWTAGERFVVAHRQPQDASPDAYLHVRDGRPALASAEAPQSRTSSTIICPAEELIGVLAGSGTAAEVAGDERPLSLLASWLDRAQSG